MPFITHHLFHGMELFVSDGATITSYLFLLFKPVFALEYLLYLSDVTWVKENEMLLQKDVISAKVCVK